MSAQGGAKQFFENLNRYSSKRSFGPAHKLAHHPKTRMARRRLFATDLRMTNSGVGLKNRSPKPLNPTPNSTHVSQVDANLGYLGIPLAETYANLGWVGEGGGGFAGLPLRKRGSGPVLSGCGFHHNGHGRGLASACWFNGQGKAFCAET